MPAPHCRACGAPIVFVTMAETGKSHPVNDAPDSRVTIVTDDGRVVSGRTSHFATCPAADQFRSAKDARRAAGAR